MTKATGWLKDNVVEVVAIGLLVVWCAAATLW